MILAAFLLILCMAEMTYFVCKDAADYAAFKLLTHTRDRQQRFRAWIVKSFLLFTGTSLIGLSLLHRFDSLRSLPTEFAVLATRVPAIHLNSGFLAGFLPAAVIGGVALGVVIAKRSKTSAGAPALGDIEPLMPRNWPETAHTALLSLNAGLSEELYFRLLLPLLLTILIRNALAAFIIAALLFGLIHAYQGVAGVFATAFLGLLLTGIYLSTGSIWFAIALHAGIDLVGLVGRPTIVRLVRSSRP